MLTSAMAAEGKSLVIANLAVVMAQAAKRVLVVDCDIRRPTLHLYLGTRQLPGLTGFLVDGIPLDDAIVPTKVPNLWLMPSGALPPNPSELLDSVHMRGIWEQLSPGYDQILVDSPPLLAVTDGALLAGQVDGVVLVVEAGETRADAAQEAKHVLVSAGGRVIGAVLNQVRDGQGRYYYRYHYGYYGESERSTS
jgi:capsular exopolysaccharide synthesis family protein